MANYTSPLPKIPGFYQSFMEIKNKYPIGTDLEVINKIPFIKSIEKKNEIQCVDKDVAMAVWAKGYNIMNKRNWMALDHKEVLTFDAYYKSDIHGSSNDVNCIIKKLKIIYFLVDDTIQVNEPMKHNSGSPQGCFIKKQKIPLPGFGQDMGPYYKIIDLVVGGNVIFYGKELKITGVDNYTRDFLNKMGIDVPENEPIPDDPYFIHRKKTELDVKIKKKIKVFQNQPPNGLDRLILRFRGYWDNRFEMEGGLHFYEVLYHLVDDTMELAEEIVDENDFNKIHRKKFVKRQKLPKRGPWCSYPGHDNDQEILNVITNQSNEFYYKMDNRILGDKSLLYYHAKDLYIGAVLNVYDRYIVLVKCDNFTKDYYKTKFGLKKFEPIEAPKTEWEIEEEKLNQERVEIVLKNQDEVARRRLIRYYDGKEIIFRFLIKMITDDLINQQRNFIMMYYLDDTAFAIYEFRETNSGIRGGMFRSRRKFNEKLDEKEKFVFHQLTVGFKMSIDEFKFVITDMDDKTLKFMIQNPTESLDEFRTKYFQGRKLIEREEFRSIISFDGELDPHTTAIFALVHKRPDPFEPFSDEVFRSVVQDTLKRARFVQFDGLRCNFRKRGTKANQEKYLEREQTIRAMKSNKVPLSWDIANILLDKFTDTEHDLVRHVDMVDFMDYIKYPVEHPNGLARDLLFVKSQKALVKADEFVDTLRTDA